MEKNQQSEQLVGRFYTLARRFQQRLGSLPDGSKIPGGPYTYTQFVVMLGVLMLGWITRGAWGRGSPIGDFILLVAVAYGVGVLIGRIPPVRRKLLGLIGSSIALLTHPGPGGRYKGRPLRLTRKAQKIQRNQKNATKTKQWTKKQKESTTPQADLSPGVEVPTFYGSSLNRLLQEHGLLGTEGKH